MLRPFETSSQEMMGTCLLLASYSLPGHDTSISDILHALPSYSTTDPNQQAIYVLTNISTTVN